MLALLVLGGTALGAATGPRADGPAAPAPARATAPSAPASSPVPPPVVATPAPAAAAVPVCRPGDLRAAVRAARGQVGPGRPLGLRLTVRNTGPACRLPADPVRLRVVSGPDRIWSSDHCGPLRRLPARVLQRGAAVALEARWDGRRSRPRCAGPFEPSRPGVYRVRAEVGDLRARPDEFAVRR